MSFDEHSRDDPQINRKVSVSLNSDEDAARIRGLDKDRVQPSFIQSCLAETARRPQISWSNWTREVIWFNILVITSTPLLSAYGLWTTEVKRNTVLFSIAYYIYNMLGITAGYHRLWSHRAYNASKVVEAFLVIGGTGAVQGSVIWWGRHHRAHHRYTDTDLDPYSAHRGLFWSHVGWMMVKPRVRPGPADVSDLKRHSILSWQHRHFFSLAFVFGIVVPTVVCGWFWDDWRGGIFIAGFLRLTFVHHCVFSVNSLAHWLGDATFDDRHSPRDHLLTALVTLGEGYHNFHHQFPMDYRNATQWYQWDPTKWFIATCAWVGLASQLKRFPEIEVRKTRLGMKMKALRREQDDIPWPASSDELPTVSWDEYQMQAQERPLILVAGFIHDVGSFLEQHPGGIHILRLYMGKDATTAFFGGIYEHGSAAHNLLATMRVGVFGEGLDDRAIPPCSRLRIVSS